MVLPGWNVTEPLHVAGKFYSFVQQYRGAPEQIKAFAAYVKKFTTALEAFDSCLEHSGSIPTDDLDRLSFAADGFRTCAKNCQAFVSTFFTDNKVGPGDQLNWVWRKDKADALKKEMNEQVEFTNLHLHLTTMKDQQRRKSAIEGSSTRPLTPGRLLRVDADVTSSQPPTRNNSLSTLIAAQLEGSTAVSSMNSAYQPDERSMSVSPHSDGRPYSFLEYVPQEILQRRDSEVSLSLPSSATTMDNLDGVTIFYRTTATGEPRPVQKLEFLHDMYGDLRYIIATLPAAYNARFFQRVLPSPRVIPHSEHPQAYEYQKIFRVKFLEPQHLTSQRWLSSPMSAASIGSGGTSSTRSASVSSVCGTPDTFPSSASIISSMSIGSPSLSARACRFVDETNYPKYEFRHEEDFIKFQENLIGKTLLLTIPVNQIISQQLEPPRMRVESHTQCLRLWSSGRSQSIMYHANLLAPWPQYFEHDIEHFRNDPESPDGTVTLLVKQSTTSPPMVKRQGMFRSLLQSPSKNVKPTDDEDVVAKSELPENLQNLSALMIHFTYPDDRVSFLKRAKFYGTPDASAIPPFPFQQPSYR